MSILASIFGSSKVIESATKLIDDAFYTDAEKAEDKLKNNHLKTKNKIDLMNAYAPFKLAQRVIAFSFVFVFLFILLNGILALIYGFVDIENVKMAKEFANEMWLGEIVLAIITFYFGGGLVSSIKNKKE